MELISVLLLGILVIVLISFMFLKASYHFQYLKLVDPIKFRKYNSYLDMFDLSYNESRLSLILPFFEKRKRIETNESKELIFKILYYCNLIKIFIVVIILYVILIASIFGKN